MAYTPCYLTECDNAQSVIEKETGIRIRVLKSPSVVDPAALLDAHILVIDKRGRALTLGLKDGLIHTVEETKPKE